MPDPGARNSVPRALDVTYVTSTFAAPKAAKLVVREGPYRTLGRPAETTQGKTTAQEGREVGEDCACGPGG